MHKRISELDGKEAEAKQKLASSKEKEEQTRKELRSIAPEDLGDRVASQLSSACVDGSVVANFVRPWAGHQHIRAEHQAELQPMLDQVLDLTTKLGAGAVAAAEKSTGDTKPGTATSSTKQLDANSQTTYDEVDVENLAGHMDLDEN